MLGIDRERVRAAFSAYVAAYDPADPKIRLKIDHTHRVAALADALACDAALPAREVDLAWLCGMLHDIGRFEQVRRFGTFNDACSVSHAALGVDILFGEGRLADFVDLSAGERPVGPACSAASPASLVEFPGVSEDPDVALLRTAVGTHSDFRLPVGLSPRTRAFCEILRDADKVDILKAICESDPCDVLNAARADILGSAVSPAVRAAFAERRCVRRDERSTSADTLVSYTCLVFELVHPLALHMVAEQGFVWKLFEIPYENPATAALMPALASEMRAWLSARLAEPTPARPVLQAPQAPGPANTPHYLEGGRA